LRKGLPEDVRGGKPHPALIVEGSDEPVVNRDTYRPSFDRTFPIAVYA
jgi:hypothetical protein